MSAKSHSGNTEFTDHLRGNKWMLAKMQEHIREINGIFVEELIRVQRRYKEYDDCYLEHYAQWFFWFFFVLRFSLFIIQ